VLRDTVAEYRWEEDLGGRRSRVAGSVNGGWEVEAFQGYADWTASPAFAAALARLEDLARARPTTYMCAEAPWWRCHRRLISDALLVRGWDVQHIRPDGSLSAHELPVFAVVEDGRLTYPPAQLSLGDISSHAPPGSRLDVTLSASMGSERHTGPRRRRAL
jgi:hypothetical protein